MAFSQLVIIFVAGVLGGTLNSVAGGGSFIGLPSLIFTGVPPIQANATNTVGLWPGSMASVWAYRKELASLRLRFMFVLIGTSLIGGMMGSLLLLKTPPEIFQRLIPYLLFVATVLFAFSPLITRWLHGLRRDSQGENAATSNDVSLPTLVGISVAQLVIAIYGGYFGGGIGILMLATLALMGIESMHVMNGLKTVLTSCINGISVVTFIIFRAVVWLPAVVMIAGALIGGYGGAYFARKLDQRWIRWFVIVVGTTMTLSAFFNWPPGIWHK
jgi:uncharacterized protein